MQIGVDFGGTKIEVVRLNKAGDIEVRHRCPTPATYADAIAAVHDLVSRASEGVSTDLPVGLGSPGSCASGDGPIANSNVGYLNGRDFRLDLQRALHRPVRRANDADCFALSEAIDGAGAGAAIVFGAIIGTGCGGGAVIGGQLLGGPSGLAGEWGPFSCRFRA